MLNIEIIKFQAQDVITTSVAGGAIEAPDTVCQHDNKVFKPEPNEYGVDYYYCPDCNTDLV